MDLPYGSLPEDINCQIWVAPLGSVGSFSVSMFSKSSACPTRMALTFIPNEPPVLTVLVLKDTLPPPLPLVNSNVVKLL